MSRGYWILLAAALTVACATPAERRKQRPDLDITSSKPAKDVAICIAEKWESTKPFMSFSSPPVSTVLRKNGVSVHATAINRHGSSTTVALADITEEERCTHILFYKQMGGGFGDYDEAVKQCQ